MLRNILGQDGDMDSRWTCGPLAMGSRFFRFESCDVDISLNYFRYIRQIQIGEFSILPNPRTSRGGNVVRSAIRCRKRSAVSSEKKKN